MRYHAFLSGAMGSGKTWAACWRLLTHAWGFDGLAYGAVTASSAQFEAVILTTLNRQLTMVGLPDLKRRGDWWEIPAPDGYRPARLFRLLGSNREAARRVRGHNLAGVLIDEVTEMPDVEFVRLVWSRVRDPRCPSPIVLMTTNPGGPDHWALTRIADPIRRGRVAGSVQLWLPEHNPALTAEALADLKATYPEGTVGYRRYLLGEWVAQDGSVYPTHLLDQAVTPVPSRPVDRYAISVDVGYAAATHTVLWGSWSGSWVALDEWVYEGLDDRQMIAGDQVKAALTRFRLAYPDLKRRLALVAVDPSPGGPEGWLRSARNLLSGWPTRVLAADKTRLVAGIELTRRWLATGRLRFGSGRVPVLMSAMRRYHWGQPTRTGLETPVQVDDHGPDACRYLVQTVDRAERRTGGTWVIGRDTVVSRPDAGDVRESVLPV